MWKEVARVKAIEYLSISVQSGLNYLELHYLGDLSDFEGIISPSMEYGDPA
jgi:hypothetical protein